MDLELPGLTYIGLPMDDRGLAEAVPLALSAVLVDANGFVALGGAFHLRGIATEPPWHSLGAAWKGEKALHRLFPVLSVDDVPFGQDALGDQFLLRGDQVWHLLAEIGELQPTGLDLRDFLKRIAAAPEEMLPIVYVRKFQNDGGSLLPGQLLTVYPPLCTRESKAGVSLRAISATERLQFLADFAAQISELPDGSRIEIRLKNDGAA